MGCDQEVAREIEKENGIQRARPNAKIPPQGTHALIAPELGGACSFTLGTHFGIPVQRHEQ